MVNFQTMSIAEVEQYILDQQTEMAERIAAGKCKPCTQSKYNDNIANAQAAILRKRRANMLKAKKAAKGG